MKPVHAGLAALAFAVAAGCSNPLVEPADLDAQTLVRSASNWTPASLASELPVDSATRHAVEVGLQELHTTLRDLHRRLDAQGASGEGGEVILTPEMEHELRQVHARHAPLWSSLEEEVRVALVTRLHEHANQHGGEMPASLHERLRRLHGPASQH